MVDDDKKRSFEEMGLMSKTTVDIYHLINWIIMGLRPLSEVENPETKTLLLRGKLATISTKTLRKYLLQLHLVVEKKITETLPRKSIIMFDGWKCGTTKYVVVLLHFYKMKNMKKCFWLCLHC